MQELSLTAMRAESAAADHEKIDGSYEFPPKVLSCVATVALLPKRPDLLATHRAIEQAKAGMQPWPEDVSRFTTEEMEYALYALDQALLQPYSLAYYYTTKDNATTSVCRADGGIEPSDDGSIVVCAQSPVDLGWEKNGGASFRANTVRTLWGAQPVDVYAGGRLADRLEVVLVVAVPTAVLEDRRNRGTEPSLCTIPRELLIGAGVYSSAHIQKCYELGDIVSAGAAGGPVLGNPPPVATRPVPALTTTAGQQSAAPLSPAQLAQVKEAFEIFDDDSSGSISVAELEIALKSLGFNPQRHEVAAMLRDADLDNSGELDLDEFVALVAAQALSEPAKRGWLAILDLPTPEGPR
jgi:hypothetical protein